MPVCVSSSSGNQNRKSRCNPEIGSFQLALDKVYGQLRQRAAREWGLRALGTKDPADTCVSIRITGRNEPVPQLRFIPSSKAQEVPLQEELAIQTAQPVVEAHR